MRKILLLELLVLEFAILINLATSDPRYITAAGIPDEEVSSFDSTVRLVQQTINSGWIETEVFPRLVATFLASSHIFPTSEDFAKFTGDRSFDSQHILKWVEWVPRVLNKDRLAFEAEMRKLIPGFQIYIFDANGNEQMVPYNFSKEYSPIIYATPAGNEAIRGFDISNDPFEGQYIRKIEVTGILASSTPFLLHGDSPWMGMTIYIPLFKLNSTTSVLSTEWTPYYQGCVITVIQFQPMMTSVLNQITLDNIDVFMFAIETDSNGNNISTCVGYYLSGTAPINTTGWDIKDPVTIRPESITGDIVTAFDGPFTHDNDIQIADQNFRLLVRARSGTVPRDVLVFNGSSTTSSSQCSKMTQCLEGEQGSPLSLMVEDAQARDITFRSFGTLNATSCLPRRSVRCNITVAESQEGLQILEIFADGEQIPDSPIILLVKSRQCPTGSSVSSDGIKCVCPDGAYNLPGGACLTLAAMVPSVLLVAAAAVLTAIYCCRPSRRVDLEEAALHAETVRLRAKLELTRRHGFALASEWAAPALHSLLWPRDADETVVLQDRWLSAVARLSLLREDADPRHVDALCDHLQLEWRPRQLTNLYDWVLDLCRVLLDPGAAPDDSDTASTATTTVAAAAAAAAAGIAGFERTSSGISLGGGGGGGDIVAPRRSNSSVGHGRPSIMQGRSSGTYSNGGLLSLTFGSASVYPWSTHGWDDMGGGGGRNSAEERFSYFRTKVARLRIWKDEEPTQLKALKALAEGLMNRVAAQYDRRFAEFCREPGGSDLAMMPYDSVAPSQVLRSAVIRQDHEEVAAIRVDEQSRREAEVHALCPCRLSLVQLEDLFLSQLSLRAKLLDVSFSERVLQVIRRHRTTPDEATSPVPLRAGSGGITGGGALAMRRSAAANDSYKAKARARGALSIQQQRRVSLRSMDHDDPEVAVELTDCRFEECSACVELHTAPVKTVQRMREKLLEYRAPDGIWPLSANILDPVRVSVVCHGPSQMRQVLSWFVHSEKENGLPVCRVKNKFSAAPHVSRCASAGAEPGPGPEDIQGGYRDLKVFVLLTDSSELRIIGEIQIHDRAFFDNKHRTHRLYKITRSQNLDRI